MDIFTLTTQETLSRISDHCPESLSAYLQCINKSDEEGRHFFSREEINIFMSENYIKFKNNIKKLAKEDLLSWQPIDGGIAVTLAEPQGNL